MHCHFYDPLNNLFIFTEVTTLATWQKEVEKADVLNDLLVLNDWSTDHHHFYPFTTTGYEPQLNNGCNLLEAVVYVRKTCAN